MKRYVLILIFATTLAGHVTPLRAQCPEDPRDNGVCDTMYVEVFPPDTLLTGFVRVPIFVTHDVPNPLQDSLAMFQIPLCYTHTNPSKYCSVSHHWNSTALYPSPDSLLERSLFRHLMEDGDTVIHNWMMDQSQQLMGLEWSNRSVFLDGTSYIWFFLRRINLPEQHFGDASRVLLATITFRMEDTMTICVDSCFWPPSNQLQYIPKSTVGYVPRHNLPCCFSLSYPAVGDVNADGTINIGDVVHMINYLYRQGPAPPAPRVGDANCDQIVDVGDVVFLIIYLFRGGPPPECP